MTKAISVTEKKGDVTVVRLLESRLYQQAVGPFRETMLALVEQGIRKIVVDLSGVEVMNSSGLGVLILVWDRLSKKKGKMAVSGLNPLLRELFVRMKLVDLFQVTETVDQAIRKAGGNKKIPAY